MDKIYLAYKLNLLKKEEDRENKEEEEKKKKEICTSWIILGTIIWLINIVGLASAAFCIWHP